MSWSWATPDGALARLGAAGVALLLTFPAVPATAQTVPEESIPPENRMPLEPAVPEQGDEGAVVAPEPWELKPPLEEIAATAAGALTFFMSSRDYRRLRELRSVMTPTLRNSLQRDSSRFNGKQGVRLAAFDFTAANFKSQRSRGRKGAATIVDATVRSLWVHQGEVVQKRVEKVRLAREDDGLWRVGRLEELESESVKFDESVPGVTTLRKILRAWHRRHLASAREHMTAAFLGKYEGHDENLDAIFTGDRSLRRAAFTIEEVEPSGATKIVARIRLHETAYGQPGSLQGARHTLRLVKIGSRWLLDAWQ